MILREVKLQPNWLLSDYVRLHLRDKQKMQVHCNPTEMFSPTYIYQYHLTLPWSCSFRINFSDIFINYVESFTYELNQKIDVLS